jgi:histidinol-phosphate/aromatic aminotransferase/cobyric acid decarboxylase-like protein
MCTHALPTLAAGFDTTAAEDPHATLMCMVNPTNPTGDYMDVHTVRGGGGAGLPV